ncbi:Asp23/Gls24 family envelope stress response protein [Collinsella tanakaei]|nr:Asp23/Gls24 family envelope stress response protein [Collinsella tanakaei]MBM6775901.1 Asp23/Gls24 family envelope stress response protein [Collinsella tanakaei]MBM6784999.1 Asp23/Gls24 family envelope stress response protein [Collinsella tanakaei]MBM6904903.1 Asp23/Gls24 family envelope stress response protein [Collinsella tanakaei]MCF6412672.1 Asp23/Gls24 family envelope stress response protein [Collinsella tanakaei]
MADAARASRKEITVSDIIPGSLSVSNDVIADIAGYAAMSCYGVVGMAEQQQGVESMRLLPGQRLRKGVLVSATENGLQLDLHIVLESGVNMKSVCQNLASSVSFTLSEIAQINPANLKIAIHIDALKSRG